MKQEPEGTGMEWGGGVGGNNRICKKAKRFWKTISVKICSELVISRKEWFCICIYRPSNYNNLSTFFDEITLSLNKAALKFEKFIVMGDFNIDVNASGPGKKTRWILQSFWLN